MNLFTTEALRLFVVFFVPGFISMRAFSLLVASERHDFSKSLVEAIAFSCLNFALLYWPMSVIHSNDFAHQYPILYYLSALGILLVAPCAWAWLFYRIMISDWYSKRFRDPYPTPWDSFFARGEACWVVIHLKSGRKIGGIYSGRSRASAYPTEQQVYLEEVWEVDQKTQRFLRKKNRTAGLIISRSEMTHIEFYS